MEMISCIEDIVEQKHWTERGRAALRNSRKWQPECYQHILPHTIIKKITPLFGGFTSASGRNISDSWHMRRSDFFVCNTSLLFCYLFGTAKVNFN